MIQFTGFVGNLYLGRHLSRDLVFPGLHFQKTIHIFGSCQSIVVIGSSTLVDLIDGLQKFSTILCGSVVIPIGIICKKKTSHGSAGVSVILTEFIHTGHSGCVIPAAKIIDKCIGSIIVADCDHGVQCIVQLILAVFGGKTVIIFIYGTHDIELDQAGSLHLLIVDGTFGIFCKIAYIYGPGSVIGGKKRLYLIQKVVHAGIRIVCESASAGWGKSSFFLSGRRTVLAARSFGRIGGCRCICGFFLCGRTLDLS